MSQSTIQVSPAAAATGSPDPSAGGLRRHVRLTDGFLLAAVALWLLGVNEINVGAMGQDGLLPALPIIYFVGIALLLVSFALVLAHKQISKLRLVAHVVALIFMLHGTAPLIYAEPQYAFLYKHVGVVQYINLHGQLNRSVDIYQNWPGFFALAAWFDHLAGVASPLSYAAWAQVFFDLLTALEVAFAFRALPLTTRERWLGLMLFTAGNWVGADYFSPQALGFVLSLGVLAIALNGLVSDRPRRRWARAGAAAPADEPIAGHPRPARTGPIIAILAVYFVLVLTHQLSPYIVVAQLGALTVFGKLRPRWLVIALAAIALAYLAPAFAFVNRTFGLLAGAGNFGQNVRPPTTEPTLGLSPAVQLSTHAADLLVVGLGLLALVGVVRRLRARQPVAIVVLLAVSPVFVVVFQSYGGEAILRAYLFSLPWAAALAASALRPAARAASTLRPEGRRLHFSVRPLAVPIVLLAAFAAFLPSELALAGTNVMPSGEVAAATYFYTHAPPGSVLMTTADFPTKLSGRYNQYAVGQSDSDPSLLNDVALRAKMLGASDLGQVATQVRSYEHTPGAQGYMVISTSQEIYATDYGQLPAGSLQHLAAAMRASTSWRVVFSNTDATIFELIAPGGTS